MKAAVVIGSIVCAVALSGAAGAAPAQAPDTLFVVTVIGDVHASLVDGQGRLATWKDGEAIEGIPGVTVGETWSEVPEADFDEPVRSFAIRRAPQASWRLRIDTTAPRDLTLMLHGWQGGGGFCFSHLDASVAAGSPGEWILRWSTVPGGCSNEIVPVPDQRTARRERVAR